jgi:hypothetical protein
MAKFSDSLEKISAGEQASIENTHSTALALSVISDNGCQVEIELMPGQVLGFSAGDTDAKIVLHHGDPAGLLIIKPELPS